VIAIARDWRSADLGEQDKAMLAFAEKLSSEAAAMSKDDIDRLRGVGFSDQQILEIVGSVSYRHFSNRLNLALGLGESELQGDPELIKAVRERAAATT
jgi:uncharacterized peroxidase-related enzyme